MNDELPARAEPKWGTTAVSDTVRAALPVAAKEACARQVQWLTDGGLADLAEPDQRDAMWR